MFDHLINNKFVSAESGNGFIGEFNGAVSALTSNSDGFSPIGLVNGSAGPLGFDGGGSDSRLRLTPAGINNPVLSGVTFPFNPVGVEFGATASGIAPSMIISTWSSTGAPAIGIPEPASILGAFTAVSLGIIMKRKKHSWKPNHGVKVLKRG